MSNPKAEGNKKKKLEAQKARTTSNKERQAKRRKALQATQVSRVLKGEKLHPRTMRRLKAEGKI